MHGTHLPLRTWFIAAYLVATHSNSISALQLQAKLGLGSYKTAWLLLHKLRRAMVNPGRTPLRGDVEVDESSIPYRLHDGPPEGGQGKSLVGKIFIIGAVEKREGRTSGRIRLNSPRTNAATSSRSSSQTRSQDAPFILMPTGRMSAFPIGSISQPTSVRRMLFRPPSVSSASIAFSRI
jgi:hypothetical protein